VSLRQLLDRRHPIWLIGLIAVAATASSWGSSAVNATTFDAGEVRTGLETGAITGAVTAFVVRRLLGGK
jgi:hypothetical protein